MEHRPFLGINLIQQIAPVLGVEPERVRRIVLDIQHNDIVKAYVELLADTRILEINWTGHLQTTTVMFAEENGLMGTLVELVGQGNASSLHRLLDALPDHQQKKLIERVIAIVEGGIKFEDALDLLRNGDDLSALANSVRE